MQTDILGADTPPHCARGRVCYGGAECGCELGESGWMAGSRVKGWCGLSGSSLVPFCSLSCRPCLGWASWQASSRSLTRAPRRPERGHQRRVEGTADIRGRVQRPTALRWSRLPGCVARLSCGWTGPGARPRRREDLFRQALHGPRRGSGLVVESPKGVSNRRDAGDGPYQRHYLSRLRALMNLVICSRVCLSLYCSWQS